MMKLPLLLLKSSMVRARSCLVKGWRLHHLASMLKVKNLLNLCKLKYSYTVKWTILNLFCTSPMMEPPLLLLKSSMVRARSCLVEGDGFASLGRYATGLEANALCKLKYFCSAKWTILHLSHTSLMMEPRLLLQKCSMVRARSCTVEGDGFPTLCQYATG